MTHGREEALVHALRRSAGIAARALRLVGLTRRRTSAVQDGRGE